MVPSKEAPGIRNQVIPPSTDRDMVAVAVVVEGAGRAGKVQVMLPPALPLPQAPCVVEETAPSHVNWAIKDTEGANVEVEDASRVRVNGKERGAMVGENPVIIGRGV